MRPPLKERAAGRWRSMLPSLGVDASFLNGKHGPCPICKGGRDRFMFDDKDGRGTWICHSCDEPQAGDGVDLVMRANGWTFKEAARQIEGLIGTAEIEARKTARSDDDKRDALRSLWASSKPVTADSAAGRFLRARVGLTAFPRVLRSVDRLVYRGDRKTWHPAMIALVCGADDRPVNLHRTYLTEEGGKAEVEECRRMMEGSLPKGCAVRLFDPADEIGIAEGIETALAASALFSIPCWAAINSSLLAQWLPPAGTKRVVIFGDNDPKFGGQAAAYQLAHRLAVKGVAPRIEVPTIPGQDWNDVLLSSPTHRAA